MGEISRNGWDIEKWVKYREMGEISRNEWDIEK
jgi:hypothetical protein